MSRAGSRVVLAGWVLGLGVTGVGLASEPVRADAGQIPPVVAPPLPDPCAVPVVGGLCDVPGLVVEGVTSAAQGVADGVIEAFAHWIASGAAGFLEEAGRAIFSGTEPRLTALGEDGRPWFLAHYDKLALVALGLFAPLFILAVLHGVLTGSGGLVARAVANLPIAALGTAVAVVVVQALLTATDTASRFIASGLGADTENFLSGMTSALLHPPVGQGAPGPFGIVLIALLMAFAALVVWLELLVREAAIYLTVAFLPLGFATHIWPALSSWLRRLIEVIVALILSKLVIVASLSLAGAALANQEGFAALVAGAGMLLLAAFAPFALFKLIPIASMAAIASLEGQGRRGVRAAVPRASTAFYVHQLAGSHRRSHTGRSAVASHGGAGSGTGASPPPSSGAAPTPGPPTPAAGPAAGAAAGKAGVAATAATGGAAAPVAAGVAAAQTTVSAGRRATTQAKQTAAIVGDAASAEASR